MIGRSERGRGRDGRDKEVGRKMGKYGMERKDEPEEYFFFLSILREVGD